MVHIVVTSQFVVPYEYIVAAPGDATETLLVPVI